jgi:uncharacterized integral membrane protein (TIGR00698 family)
MLLPGLILSLVVASGAGALALVEERVWGHALLEALVLALLLGVVARLVLPRTALWTPGAEVAAKQLLELGVARLGLTVNVPVLVGAGAGLLALVGLGVLATLGVGFTAGRLLGLTAHQAILVAAGNAICGNSAIAALAPAIGATKRDVASAIALTAVLGLAVVVLLPLSVPLLGISLYQYGVLAGMSVYAVPQVLAATFPVSQVSGEVGTLVKLLRVLLLGPVVLVVGVLFQRVQGASGARQPWRRYVPWFVAAFLGLAAANTLGLVPSGVVTPAQAVSRSLTAVAMAGLGFGVELSAVRRVGGRIALAVLACLAFTLSLVALVLKLTSLGA